jgi:hypothetical protein
VRSRFLRGTRNRSRVCGQVGDACCLLLGAGGDLVARGVLLVERNGRGEMGRAILRRRRSMRV